MNYSRPTANVRIWGNPSDTEGLVAAVESFDVNALAQMGGRWAAVIERDDRITVIQDPVRSLPLFFTNSALNTADAGLHQLTITDEIAVAREAVSGGTTDSAGRLEFSQLGYVTGARTLFAEISQVQAGEWVTFNQDGSREQDFYRRLRYTGRYLTAEADLDARFTEALETSFKRMFEWVGNRQIVIPLSGGLDSRLLAIAMHDRGHQNVVNFTYGVGETSEVSISRAVAQALGQRWEFIQYTQEELRGAWQSHDAVAFIRDCYAGASLPHVQDWYAVHELRRRGLIEDDAVFLAGHTVVGNMHDDDIIDAPGKVARSTLFDLLIAHHANIQSTPRLQHDARFRAEFEQYLDRIDYDGSPRSRLEALENWNILERQTKYINNSMRGYEHFGYDWALPMLDVAVFEAWEDFAIEPAKDREWYRRYVARRYANATGVKIGTFAPTNIAASRREQMKAVLRAVGLLTLAERLAMARAVAHHPMGFLAFSGQASDREVRREIMHGGTPMGIWAKQFLADTWAPGTQLFTERG